MTAEKKPAKKKSPLRKSKVGTLQTLAKKLLSAKTRSAAENILSDMVEVSGMGRAYPDEYIEETYLGIRDDDDFGEGRTNRTTMKDVKKLARHYLKK